MKKIFIILILFIFSIVVLGNTEEVLYPIKYKDLVIKYSTQFKLEPEFVLAVIKAESGFDKDVISKKNAIGLMQLMPQTAASGAKLNNIENFNEKMLLDPDINIKLGCWYLSRLYLEHVGMGAVIIAYNAGGRNVKNWFGNIDYRKLSYEEISKNIRFGETKIFLKHVINNYKQYKKIYSGKLEV